MLLTTNSASVSPAHEVAVLCNCGDATDCVMERYVADVRIAEAEIERLRLRVRVQWCVMVVLLLLLAVHSS